MMKEFNKRAILTTSGGWETDNLSVLRKHLEKKVFIHAKLTGRKIREEILAVCSDWSWEAVTGGSEMFS